MHGVVKCLVLSLISVSFASDERLFKSASAGSLLRRRLTLDSSSALFGSSSSNNELNDLSRNVQELHLNSRSDEDLEYQSMGTRRHSHSHLPPLTSNVSTIPSVSQAMVRQRKLRSVFGILDETDISKSFELRERFHQEWIRFERERRVSLGFCNRREESSFTQRMIRLMSSRPREWMDPAIYGEICNIEGFYGQVSRRSNPSLSLRSSRDFEIEENVPILDRSVTMLRLFGVFLTFVREAQNRIIDEVIFKDAAGRLLRAMDYSSNDQQVIANEIWRTMSLEPEQFIWLVGAIIYGRQRWQQISAVNGDLTRLDRLQLSDIYNHSDFHVDVVFKTNFVSFEEFWLHLLAVQLQVKVIMDSSWLNHVRAMSLAVSKRKVSGIHDAVNQSALGIYILREILEMSMAGLFSSVDASRYFSDRVYFHRKERLWHRFVVAMNHGDTMLATEYALAGRLCYTDFDVFVRAFQNTRIDLRTDRNSFIVYIGYFVEWLQLQAKRSASAAATSSASNFFTRNLHSSAAACADFSIHRPMTAGISSAQNAAIPRRSRLDSRSVVSESKSMGQLPVIPERAFVEESGSSSLRASKKPGSLTIGIEQVYDYIYPYVRYFGLDEKLAYYCVRVVVDRFCPEFEAFCPLDLVHRRLQASTTLRPYLMNLRVISDTQLVDLEFAVMRQLGLGSRISLWEMTMIMLVDHVCMDHKTNVSLESMDQRLRHLGLLSQHISIYLKRAVQYLKISFESPLQLLSLWSIVPMAISVQYALHQPEHDHTMTSRIDCSWQSIGLILNSSYRRFAGLVDISRFVQPLCRDHPNRSLAYCLVLLRIAANAALMDDVRQTGLEYLDDASEPLPSSAAIAMVAEKLMSLIKFTNGSSALERSQLLLSWGFNAELMSRMEMRLEELQANLNVKKWAAMMATLVVCDISEPDVVVTEEF